MVSWRLETKPWRTHEERSYHLKPLHKAKTWRLYTRWKCELNRRKKSYKREGKVDNRRLVGVGSWKKEGPVPVLFMWSSFSMTIDDWSFHFNIFSTLPFILVSEYYFPWSLDNDEFMNRRKKSSSLHSQSLTFS